jgi:ABC-type glycerol-3-phosphate transport system substrate-binding protein
MSKQLKVLIILCLCIASISVNAQQPSVVLQLSLSGFSEDTILAAVEQYEALNPDIDVQLNPYHGRQSPIVYNDDVTTYQDDLASYFSSADVLLIDSELTSEATRAGYVLDLSPLIQSDPNFYASDYHSTLLDSFQWDLGQWAIPVSTDFIVMSYNPEAFDNAGLAYPADWWTIDALDFSVRELTQYDADGEMVMSGINLQGFSNELTIQSLFVSLLGHGTVNDNAFPSKPDFTDPLLATYLGTWNTMVADGLFEVPIDIDENEIPLQIGNPQQTAGRGRLGNNENDTQMVTTLLPGGYVGLNTTGYAISSGTQYPQEAYNLIMFLTSDPNVVNISSGATPAQVFLDTSIADDDGPGFFGGDVVEELQPLVDTALIQALPISQMRFSQGIITALDLMQSDGLDAQTALIDVTTLMLDRLVVADDRFMGFPIFVQAPEVDVTLAESEISLDFAVLGRGGGAIEVWEQVAEEFVAFDPEVADIHIAQENDQDLTAVAETYQCFYSNSNEVPDLDLDTVLSLDPLIFADPSYDPYDYIAGVLEQVQINNQTYAIPLQISPVVLRFNEDILNQAGVFSPQGTWTVSEFEDTLQQLQFAIEDGQTSLELSSSSQSSVLSLIAIYGGLPFDTRTDPLTIDFTSPVTVNAIQQFLNLAYDRKIEFSTQGGFGGGGNQDTTEIPMYSNIMNAIPGGGLNGGGGQATNEAGVVTFPQGFEYNAVAFDLATAYISSSAQNPEACYRFISYVAQSTNIFESMPARHSLINSNDLFVTQGESTVNFYRELATLIEQPNTVILPANIDATTGAFGVTTWLFDVFTNYLNDEIIDLEADLMDAQQTTNDYLRCVESIPMIDEIQGITPQDYFAEIQTCQTSVSTQ